LRARTQAWLRKGAPFKDWPLSSAIEKVRAKLASTHDGIAGADLILNVLARCQQTRCAN
jgi:hypothetical protein